MSKENTPQGEIHQAMAKIISEVGHIGKNQKNQGQGFQFRGIDDIYDSLHPILSKHGVVVLPNLLDHTVTDRPTRSGGLSYHHVIKVEYSFSAPDGSNVKCSVGGEAMDSGDKGLAKAMSVALKYAMFQTFLIPVRGATPDPDADTPEETSVPLASEQAKHEIEELLDQVKKIDPEIESKVFAFAKVKSVNEIQAKQVASIIKKLKTTLEANKTNG